MIRDTLAACPGLHGLVKTEPNFLQVFVFTGNNHLQARVRAMELLTDFGDRGFDFPVRIYESRRDFDGLESTLDQVKVFADRFAATCAVFFPFVLDQAFAGHDGKHVLYQRVGNVEGR